MRSDDGTRKHAGEAVSTAENSRRPACSAASHTDELRALLVLANGHQHVPIGERWKRASRENGQTDDGDEP
jgi:hypothetical protein